MANFNRVRPLGWGFKADLTSAEANQLDIDHSKAINGDDGSSHAPAAPVIINGAGIQSDNIGNSTLTGTLTAANGSTIDLQGAATINTTGAIAVENGGSIVVAATGFIHLSDFMALRVAPVELALAAAGNVTVPASVTHLRLSRDPADNPPVGNVLTLPDEAASANRVLHIWCPSGARAARIRNSADSATIAEFPISTDGAVSVVCNGTVWRVFSWSGALASLSL